MPLSPILAKPSEGVLPAFVFLADMKAGPRVYCERVLAMAGLNFGDHTAPLRLTLGKAEIVLTAQSSGESKAFPLPIKAVRLARALRMAGESLLGLGAVVIGGFVFDPLAMTLQKQDESKPIKLTEKEAALLVFFLNHGVDQSVTRQQILDHVWAYAPDVETHTLETHIYRLRQKLEDNPAQPKILMTDDAGYRLIRTQRTVEL
jgi:DNA-binding winged helix-turn-helix (wHTH) protein